MKTQIYLDTYELIRSLGQGGMGEVFLAKHKLLGREVAVKALHPQLISKESIRQRFKNEAATLARIQHPNIVALHDYVENDSGAFLILEYVEGRDLDEYIHEETGPIPEPKLSKLFRQILEAFTYAHKQNIVHRDIKPSNFVITADEQIKVLDFGIAKILDDTDNKLTKTGTSIGTVLYMSPEQVRGEKIDHRSDIYSLGVTLFQMATGICPYDKNTTEFRVYEQIVNHPLPRASSLYPGVSPHIEAVIQKATQKAPEDRFQNCEEFLAAILNPDFQSGKPAQVPPVKTSATPQATKVVNSPSIPKEEPAAPKSRPDGNNVAPKRKKKTALWIGLAAALVIGGVVLFLLLSGGAKDKYYIIASNLYMRNAPSMNSDRMTTLPYGKEVVAVEKPNSEWIEIRHKEQKAFLPIKYLVRQKDFLILDHVCKNVEAGELLRGSFHKLALRDYFEKNKFRVDLPEEKYKEIYDNEDKDPSQIWYVEGISSENDFNAAIPSIKLEKGKWSKKENKNMVAILSNKADPDQRRLVAFRFVKDSNTEIGSLDLSDPKYHDRYIQAVKLEDLNYRVRNGGDLSKIRSELKNGKEGILLAKGSDDYNPYLITWTGFNDFNVYSLTKSWSRW